MQKWIYKHYKWKLYEVLWEIIHTETLDKLVLYKALYNSDEFWNNALWVRPKSMFLENVEINWKIQSRLEYIWNNDYKNV